MRALLVMMISFVLAGCAVGGLPPDPEGTSSELERRRNTLCDHASFTHVLTGSTDVQSTGHEDADRSSIYLVWYPASVGPWDIVVVGPDTDAGVPPSVALLQPLCNRDGSLQPDAFSRNTSMQFERGGTTIASYEVTTTGEHRIWVDVFEPPGVTAHVYVRQTPPQSALPPADPCASATTCADCTMRATCGWCDGECITGTYDIPTACGAWSWTADECPGT